MSLSFCTQNWLEKALFVFIQNKFVLGNIITKAHFRILNSRIENLYLFLNLNNIYIFFPKHHHPEDYKNKFLMKKKRHFFKFLQKNFTTIETKNVMLQLLLIVIRIKIGI